MTAYLEFNGQIVTFEVQNTSVSTGVSIKKTGPVQAVPGQPIRYVFSQIKNSSTVALDSFYWRDQLPAQVTLSKIVTGSYNQPLFPTRWSIRPTFPGTTVLWRTT